MRGLIKPLLVCLAIGIASCNSSETKSARSDTDSVALTPAPTKTHLTDSNANKDSLLLALTKELLTSLRSKDYETFARYIHPSGVRFSPYGNVDTAKNVMLSKTEFLAMVRDKREFEWGNYDGSGEPINLSIAGYFDKFVYSADFLHAEKTSINKMLGKGNSKNNLEEVYKRCDYTESYFAGFDKKYEGMDWSALRLVFKKSGGKYYLAGVVHDQWTT